MNREQAENILEAYISMECSGGNNKACQSLREVILDAMTEYKSKPTMTWPGITVSPTGSPTNWDSTPKVTCTGIDPAFGINLAAVDDTATIVGYQDGVVKVVDR